MEFKKPTHHINEQNKTKQKIHLYREQSSGTRGEEGWGCREGGWGLKAG